MSDDLARSRQTQGTHRRRHDSGLKGDPEYKRMLDKVKRLCGVNGNSTNLISVVAEYDNQQTNPLQLIKRATPERSVSSRYLHTDASTCQKPRQRKNTQR